MKNVKSKKHYNYQLYKYLRVNTYSFYFVNTHCNRVTG